MRLQTRDQYFSRTNHSESLGRDIRTRKKQLQTFRTIRNNRGIMFFFQFCPTYFFPIWKEGTIWKKWPKNMTPTLSHLPEIHCYTYHKHSSPHQKKSTHLRKISARIRKIVKRIWNIALYVARIRNIISMSIRNMTRNIRNINARIRHIVTIIRNDAARIRKILEHMMKNFASSFGHHMLFRCLGV